MADELEIEDPFGPDLPIPAPRKSAHGFRRKKGDFMRDALAVASGGDPEKTGAVKAKKKQADHNQRTADWFTKKGYLYVRTEYWITRPDGYQWKKDLLGFADGMAFKDGRFYAVQIKSKDGMQSAIREMASSQSVKGQPFPTKRENYDAFVKAGGKVIVIGWEKGERFWECEHKLVTAEDIEAVDRRRRV